MQLCIITKSASVQLRAAGFSQKYAKLVGSSTIYGFLLAPPTHLLPPAAFEKNAKNPNNPGFGICLAWLAWPACSRPSFPRSRDQMGLAGTKMEIRWDPRINHDKPPLNLLQYVVMDFWEKLRLRKCLSGSTPPWFCVKRSVCSEPILFFLGTVVLLIHFNLFLPSLSWVQNKHLGECNLVKRACNCAKTNKQINKQSPVKVHVIDRQ